MSIQPFLMKKAALAAVSLSTIILLASIPLAQAVTSPAKPTGEVTLSITGGWKVHLTVDNPTDTPYEATFHLDFYNFFHGWSGGSTMIITPHQTTDFAQRPLVLFGKISAQLSVQDQALSKNGTIRFGYVTFP